MNLYPQGHPGHNWTYNTYPSIPSPDSIPDLKLCGLCHQIKPQSLLLEETSPNGDDWLICFPCDRKRYYGNNYHVSRYPVYTYDASTGTPNWDYVTNIYDRNGNIIPRMDM